MKVLDKKHKYAFKKIYKIIHKKYKFPYKNLFKN